MNEIGGDVRQSLTKMPDRFSEHPQTVLAVTNMTYKAAPGLQAMTERGRRDTNWIEMPLTGNTAIDFDVFLFLLYFQKE